MIFFGVITCLMIIFTLLFKLSETAKYYIKLALFLSNICWSCIWPLPLLMLRGRKATNSRMPSTLMIAMTKLLFFKLKMRGEENFDKSRGAVIIMNHQSMVDCLVMAHLYLIFERIVATMKSSLLYMVPVGTSMWYWNTVFLDRSNGSSAKKKLVQTAESIQKQNFIVTVFPEGTRRCSDVMQPFKKGAFCLAVNAQCPIQPIVISKYHFLNHKAKRFNSAPEIYATILPPIETKGMTKDDIPKLMEKSYNIMMEAYTRLSEEDRPKE